MEHIGDRSRFYQYSTTPLLHYSRPFYLLHFSHTPISSYSNSPLNAGFLFSRKAPIPSFASALLMQSPK